MRLLPAFALIGGLSALALAGPADAAHGRPGGAPPRGATSPPGSPGGHRPFGAGYGGSRPQGRPGPGGGYRPGFGYRGVGYGYAGGFWADVGGYGGGYAYDAGYGDAEYQTYPVVQAYDANGWEVYGGPGGEPPHGPPAVRYVQGSPPGAYANSAYIETPGPSDLIYVSAPYIQEAVAGQPIYLSAPYSLASPSCGRWSWSNGVVTYAWIAC